MALTINQNGLTPGISDKSRSDGLSTGALISVTSSSPVNLFLIWRPDEDNNAELNQIDMTHWTLNPKPSSYGSYVFYDSTNNVKRIFAVRTPNKGLRIPALNEFANKSGSLVNNSAAIIQQSNFNETSGSGPFAAGNYGGWHSAFRELVFAAEIMTGTIGPVGPSGSAGVAGVAGPSGSAGVIGPSGSQWRVGSTVPSNGLGANNDIYLDTNNQTIYSKNSGIYSPVLSLSGTIIPPDTSILSWLVKPSVPDTSWDLDPRTMTDPDLANNGWTVTSTNSPYAVYPRTGEVTPGISPNTGTYKSSLVNGQLRVQLPPNEAVLVTKSTVATQAYTYKSRAWPSTSNSNDLVDSFVSSAGISWGASGAAFTYAGMEGANAVAVNWVGGNFPILVFNSTVAFSQRDFIRYIFADTAGLGTQAVGILLVSALNGSFLYTSGFSSIFQGNAINSAGLVLLASSANTILYIDFLRRIPSVSPPFISV